MVLAEILKNESFYHDVDWFEMKAEEGDADAQYETGVYYYRIHNISETMDGSRKAQYWLEKAAKNGNKKAMFALGSLLRYGYGEVPEDKTESDKWINKAQSYGINTLEDRKSLLLFEEFRKGYAQGDVDATVRMACCIGGDDEGYLKYLQEACDKGSGLASYLIGLHFSDEDKPNYNPRIRAKYYEIAAERGNRSARLDLIGELISGRYIKRDILKAYDYCLDTTLNIRGKFNQELAYFQFGELCLLYKDELKGKSNSLDSTYYFGRFLANRSEDHSFGEITDLNAGEIAEQTIPFYLEWLNKFPGKDLIKREVTFGSMADLISEPQPFGLTADFVIHELHFKE